ncbi:MAG: hypothetical protein ACOC44_19015 [Promethearchaeia archaeon]
MTRRKKKKYPRKGTPRRVVRKRDKRKEWLSFLIILILFISVLGGILAVVFAPT